MRWASAVDTDARLTSAVERARREDLLGPGAPGTRPADRVRQRAACARASRRSRSCCAGNSRAPSCSAAVRQASSAAGERSRIGPALSLTGALLPGVQAQGRASRCRAGAAGLCRAARLGGHAAPHREPATVVPDARRSLQLRDRRLRQGPGPGLPAVAPKIGGLASGARQVGGTALYLGNRGVSLGLHHAGTDGQHRQSTPSSRRAADRSAIRCSSRSAHENLIRETRRPRAARRAGRPVRAPAAGRSRPVQPVAVPRPGDAHGRQRIRAGRFPDPQHPRHGPAERRAVGQCQRSARTASCNSICAMPPPPRMDLERTLTSYRASPLSRPRAARCCSRAPAAASASTARPITTATRSAA